MKRWDNNDSCSLRYKTRAVLMRIMIVLVAVYVLSGWSCRSPQPAALAGDRLVLATRAMNNHIEIRMSIDGQVWTEPIGVVLNGTPAQTSSTPWIFNDGTLYHLYWMHGGNMRYATSRDGTRWLGQTDPLSRTPAPLALARSATRVLGVLRSSNGIVALDPASSTAQRSTVTQSVGSFTTVPASITHGNGKFVVAVVNSNRNAEIFQSNDGTSWSSISTVPAPNMFWVQLNHAGGQFLLAAKQDPAVCKLFTSPDAVSWTEVPLSGCSNSSTGILATRAQNETIFIENWDNRLIRASKNSEPQSETHIKSVNGQFTITTGRGPQIASLRFNQVTVNQGSAQDLTIIALGFRARTGVANSARVTFAGRLEEFASDVNAGQTVSVPLYVSPFAWLIERAGALTDDNGNLDILGVVIVGIDRGACPEGPIVDRINTARSALEQELEAKISRGRLADLKDPTSRQRVLNELQEAVKRRLGNSNTWFEDIAEEVGCGFNKDEAFKEKVIVLAGSDFVPDDTQNGVFNFLSWNQNTSVTLTNNDNSKSWTVQASPLLLFQ